MNNLILFLLGVFAQRSKAKLIQKTSQVKVTQEKFLRSLLQAHKNTAFGYDFGLSEIHTIDQFRDRIPVQSYSAFEPYIQRMAKGESNILVPDPLVYFNISSGSTGKRKLIPVTKRSRRFLSYASRTAIGFALGAAAREQRPPGKMLFPISTNSHGQTPSGIAFAPVSTSDLHLMDALSRQVFTHPFAVFQVSDTTARYYVCLLFALRNPNLRVIGATFPVLSLQMCNFLEDHADSLIQDISSGQIASWLKIAPTLRETLEQKWSADPDRAVDLRQAYKAYGRLTPMLQAGVAEAQLKFPHVSENRDWLCNLAVLQEVRDLEKIS